MDTQFCPLAVQLIVKHTFFYQTEGLFSTATCLATLIAKENPYYNLILKTLFTVDKAILEQGNINFHNQANISNLQIKSIFHLQIKFHLVMLALWG